jgi:hypothetical protein
VIDEDAYRWSRDDVANPREVVRVGDGLRLVIEGAVEDALGKRNVMGTSRGVPSAEVVARTARRASANSSSIDAA